MLTRSAWITSAGTTIEWFEFGIFVYLSPILSPLFFPDQAAGLALLQTYVLMGVGYLARPLGAIFYGHIGDRYGRKRALVTSSALIALALLFTACLPTYQHIGAWAAVLLLIARLLQGFSLGGEGSGTYVSLAEQGADHQQSGAFFGLGYMMSSLGFGLALVVVTLCHHVLGSEAMSDWGWRLPFMIGAVAGLLFWLMRQGIEEGGEFKKVQQQQSNLWPLFGLRHHVGKLCIAFFVLAMVGWLYYSAAVIFVSYSPVWLGIILTSVMTVFSWLGAAVWDKRWGYAAFCVVTISVLVGGTWWFQIAWQDQDAWLFCLLAACFYFILGYAVFSVVRIIPVSSRYSGFSIAYNAATIVGGFTPALYQWLVQREHSPVMAFGVLSTVSLVGMLGLSALPMLRSGRAAPIA